MKRILIIMMVLAVSLLSSCSKETLEKLNQEALNLAPNDVQAWLDKHNVDVPSGLENENNIETFVLDVIKDAKAGIDDSQGISYDKTIYFIQHIQEAAGYSFANRREAIFLEKNDIQSWLKTHKISIPKDLEEELDIEEYILSIIRDAQQGIDSSAGISYEKTVEFIKEIQEAAGFPF